MNLLLVSATRSAERDASKDRRAGGSSGGGLCICILFRMSKVSRSLLAGSAGRSSGISLVLRVWCGGRAVFLCGGFPIVRESVEGSRSATE